ncbi:MAG: hypothetical protein P1V20_23565 [Verrucomicrobiales bacterium]|nr:hypothetical protein [Verrucomicrobiales bacterium]
MNIKETLLDDYSKTGSSLIACYIGDNAGRFRELMSLVTGADETLSRRAAWTMSHCCESHPELISPYLPELLEQISNPETHSALKRNTLRTLQNIEFPENLTGHIFNLCYNFVNDPDETAAVRAYSITVLTEICKSEPGLATEVALLIRQHLPHSPGSYKSRARITLSVLEKLQK